MVSRGIRTVQTTSDTELSEAQYLAEPLLHHSDQDGSQAGLEADVETGAAGAEGFSRRSIQDVDRAPRRSSLPPHYFHPRAIGWKCQRLLSALLGRRVLQSRGEVSVKSRSSNRSRRRKPFRIFPILLRFLAVFLMLLYVDQIQDETPD